MTSAYDYLALTDATCRWPPCENLLAASSRKLYCREAHKVRAAQEVKRLHELLHTLTSADPVSVEERNALLAHVPNKEWAEHLEQALERITHRIIALRPGWTPPVDVASRPELQSACQTIASGWPHTEVAQLVRLALRKPEIYMHGAEHASQAP